MTERQEEVQCFLCQNQCTVTMEVSAEGLVVAAWRPIPKHNEVAKQPCKRLNQISGKNLERAQGILQKPIKPTYVAGGH